MLSKSKFICFLILAFSFFSTNGHSQVLKDSLIYIKEYEKYVDVLTFEKRSERSFTRTAQEVFVNYFNFFRVVIVYLNNASSHPKYNARMYAYDEKTSRRIFFNNELELINMLNSSKQKLCNLDKCYLYLYLYNRFTGMSLTHPRSFNHKLYRKSVFINDPLYKFFDIYNVSYVLNSSQEKEEVYLSTRKDIVMYTVANGSSTICKYNFHFSDNDDLVKVLSGPVEQ